VVGTSRDSQIARFDGLKKLNVIEQVKTVSMSPTDFRSVLQVITQTEPEEIYNLSGQSSVGLSFEQPVETMESIATGVINVLEAIRFFGKKIRFYNAGSSEVFGDIDGCAADEKTPFRPRSPYAVAKAAATWQVSVYREAYDLFACSGILFNHESPLRPNRYVTKKVIEAAWRIYNGSDEKLNLGDISIRRDWGWAPEYVRAMWLMLQQEKPDDYVIGTGRSYSLENFVEVTFDLLNLDWRDHVSYDRSLVRPSEISLSVSDPRKAASRLGWEASVDMMGAVAGMLDDLRLTHAENLKLSDLK
jgi:GDPmannose 4,6-dehydratase